MSQRLKITSTDRKTKEIAWTSVFNIVSVRQFAELNRYNQLVYYDEIVAETGLTLILPSGYKLDANRDSFGTIMTYEIIDED